MDYSQISERYNIPIDKIRAEVETARRSLVPKTGTYEIVENGISKTLTVRRDGVGPIKIKIRSDECCIFHLFDFTVDDKWKKYSALVKADLSSDFTPILHPKQALTIRIDSGCETGQVFRDVTCECSDQLVECMEKIVAAGDGMVIHIPIQDGRGMGLPFKLGTLRLQEELGVDTVEAAALLEPNSSRDVRTFAGVIAILKHLKIPETILLKLMTNNPKKLPIFGENGYNNTEIIPLVIAATDETRRHLEAKQNQLGHIDLVPGRKGSQEI